MRVIIPVAGEGKRLKPMTDSTPKPLIGVAGRPVLEHLLHWIADMDFSEIVLVIPLGKPGEMIKDFVTKCPLYYQLRPPIRFVKQLRPSGTAHAVWLALKDKKDSDRLRESVLILNGDIIPFGDGATLFWKKMLWSDKNKPFLSLIGVNRKDDPENHGVVEVDDDENRSITRFEEKPLQPKSNLTMSGIFYIHQALSLFDALEHVVSEDVYTRGELELTTALQLALEAGETFYTEQLRTFDCGSVEGLAIADKWLTHGKKHEILNPPCS